MCPDCYDYETAVLFNACAADLWRRFITYLPRHLARRLGITQKLLRSLVRVRFVKVAEYQARGVVHFHAVIRLDAPGEGYQPPPDGITADLLGDAIGQAAAAVRLPVTAPGGTRVALTFGSPQGTDVRPIRRDDITGTGQRGQHHRQQRRVGRADHRPGRGQRTLDGGPARQPAACRVLAQNLGVLLGDPVHQQRDHNRYHQHSGGRVAADRIQDRRGDDGTVY